MNIIQLAPGVEIHIDSALYNVKSSVAPQGLHADLNISLVFAPVDEEKVTVINALMLRRVSEQPRMLKIRGRYVDDIFEEDGYLHMAPGLQGNRLFETSLMPERIDTSIPQENVIVDASLSGDKPDNVLLDSNDYREPFATPDSPDEELLRDD